MIVRRNLYSSGKQHGSVRRDLRPILLVALLMGCGTVRPTVYKVEVTPSAEALAAGSQQTVTFTATGIFGYDTTRALQASDGLSWTSSNAAVAAVTTDGIASCSAPGQAMITATVPIHVVAGTSPTVSGTATLTCM